MNRLIEDNGRRNGRLAVAVGAVQVLGVDKLIIVKVSSLLRLAEFKVAGGKAFAMTEVRCLLQPNCCKPVADMPASTSAYFQPAVQPPIPRDCEMREGFGRGGLGCDCMYRHEKPLTIA